jgi:hypothetical protein
MSKLTERAAGVSVLLLSGALGVVVMSRSRPQPQPQPQPEPQPAPHSLSAPLAAAPSQTAVPPPIALPRVWEAALEAPPAPVPMEEARERTAPALETALPAARRSRQARSVTSAPGTTPAATSTAAGEPAGSAPRHPVEGQAVGSAAPPEQRGNVTIRVRPRLGDGVRTFDLIEVTTSIDGQVVATCEGSGLQESKDSVVVFQGTAAPGEHAVNVRAEYRGNGHLVFSYFERYRYIASSRARFTVADGGRSEITIDLVDRGGMSTSFEDRLAIEFLSKVHPREQGDGSLFGRVRP